MINTDTGSHESVSRCVIISVVEGKEVFQVPMNAHDRNEFNEYLLDCGTKGPSNTRKGDPIYHAAMFNLSLRTGMYICALAIK